METSTDRPSMHRATPRRSFLVLDAMILTAATAIGCGAIQWLDRATDGGFSLSTLDEIGKNLLVRLSGENWAGLTEPAATLLLTLMVLGTPLVVAWTAALIPIHLIGPQPRRCRLARQPGVMAVFALGLAIVCIGLPVEFALIVTVSGWNGVIESIILDLVMGGGLAVSAAWMTLIADRRWRCEPNWIDRLGRIVGGFWIMAGFGVWWCSTLIEGSQLCQLSARRIDPTLTAYLCEMIRSVIIYTMPVVALGALVLIPIRLFGVRLRSHRRTQPPGIMAGFAASLAMASLGLPIVVTLATTEYGWVNLEYWFPIDEMVVVGTRFGGLAVLVSWMTLLVGRRWRPEPSWIDRLGRAAGIYWIVAAFLIVLITYALTAESAIQPGHNPCPKPNRVEQLLLDPDELPADVFAR